VRNKCVLCELHGIFHLTGIFHVEMILFFYNFPLEDMHDVSHMGISSTQGVFHVWIIHGPRDTFPCVITHAWEHI